MFQSTHPCGVRRRYALLSILNSKFQSTHPCGVRQWLLLMQLWQPVFQSTHPCGVRLTLTTNLGSAKVSIHAPVWGATSKPHRGINQRHRFNPRTRVGCDILQATRPTTRKVSIHAPVWGATVGKLATIEPSSVSIHAPVWGATQSGGATDNRTRVSIHAPVWGATSQLRVKCLMVSFNPRTRVGCDLVRREWQR